MANPHPIPSPATQFQRGNPGGPGRPRGRSLTALLREALGRETAPGKTVSDALVSVLLKIALEGDRQAIRDVFERADGKVADRLQQQHSGELTIRVEYADADLPPPPPGAA